MNTKTVIVIVIVICVLWQLNNIINAAANVAEKKLGNVPVAQGKASADKSPTETMKAITWHGKEDVRVSTVPKPVLTHPKDAVIRVSSFTVCSGSDSHLYANEIPNIHKNQILGHEAQGYVEAVGSEVTKFRVGEKVVIAFEIACGECEYCKRKEFSSCDVTNPSRLEEKIHGHRTAALFGYSNLLGGDVEGSQAEYVRVPFADTNLFKIPDSVPDIQSLYMSDVLCTSYHALELGDFKKGKSVVVWGLGPIGLATCRWAQIRGASQIVGIDLVDERLERARQLGIQVIDRRKVSSVVDEISKLMPGGPDIAVEAVGFRFPTTFLHKAQRMLGLETDSPDILHECMTAVRKNGVVSCIGDYVGTTNLFKIGTMMMKHLTLRSGQCPTQKYFSTVLPYLQDGTFDTRDVFVSHQITMDQVPEAYKKLYYKQDGYIKVFVPLMQQSSI